MTDSSPADSSPTLSTPREPSHIPLEGPRRQGLLADFWQFIKEEKIWWMVPLGIVLLFFLVLVLGAQNPALAPFLYPIFG